MIKSPEMYRHWYQSQHLILNRVDSWQHIIVESVIAYTYSYIPTPLFSLHKIGLDQEEAGVSSSAGTTTPFSSNIFAKDPSLCMLIKISHPPTNSLSTYSWGIVGQSEYSLIPVVQSLASDYRRQSIPATPFMSILHPIDIGRDPELCGMLTRSQFFILQHIVCSEFFWIHTLHTQDLYRCARETTLWCFGRSFHEQYDGCGGDCFVDCGFGFAW